MNARPSFPIPTQQRSGGRLRPADNLYRAATAVLAARANAGDSEGFTSTYFQKRYPGDEVSPLLLQRASVNPATTATNAALAATSVADFVSNLPASAASKLIAAGNRLDLTGVQSISLPKIDTGFSPTWIGEGAPMPVAQLSLSDVDLGPMKKLAVITAWTLELANSSSIEALLRQSLNDAAGKSLDATLFSTAAASSTAPAGLLNGLSAVTATTGGGFSALVTDLENLAAAVVTAGGNSDGIAFVVNPKQAITLRLIAADLEFPVYASASVAAGTVIAVDAREFYSAFGPEPRLSATENATVHFDGSTPLPISTAGSPNTVAAPVRSAFASGLIALRMTLDVAYAMRTPAVAYTTSVTW